MLKILLIIVASILPLNLAIFASSPQEFRVIRECLDRFGGLSQENEQRLERYKEWSDTYEEIPCFTHCYLSKIFNFYNESSGFIIENVKGQFGLPLYEACRYQLESYQEDSCKLAYGGLHCLVSLENDPFVLIEGMENLDFEAKKAMKDCLRTFEQHEWQKLNEYAKFPVSEPIPCYTKCFIDKLQLFSQYTRRWNVSDMRTKLGIPEATANVNGCLAMNRRRNRNVCSWIYREFTCFALAK